MQVLDRGEKIELLVDKTENLHHQVYLRVYLSAHALFSVYHFSCHGVFVLAVILVSLVTPIATLISYPYIICFFDLKKSFHNQFYHFLQNISSCQPNTNIIH